MATGFFKAHLPAPIAGAIEWPKLEILPGSFIKQDLHQIHSDLLFSAPIGTERLLIYLLFEHQSAPDPGMPRRLLGYMLEIWNKYAPETGGPIPPVLPFVLHQGPEQWKVSPAFQDCLCLPAEGELAAAVLRFVPKFDYALLDLSQYDPDLNEKDPLNRFILHIMKLARERRQALELFIWLREEMLRDSALARWVRPIIWYLMHIDGRIDKAEVMHTLEASGVFSPEAMTLAEHFRVEGRMEGLAAGAAREKIRIFQKLLGAPVSADSEFEHLTLDELARWADEMSAQFEAGNSRR